MSSFHVNNNRILSPDGKLPWEPPRLVVERHLVARAEDGGGDSDETWALQRLIGPLNISIEDC